MRELTVGGKEDHKTTFILGKSKSIVNKVDSPMLAWPIHFAHLSGLRTWLHPIAMRVTAHEILDLVPGLDFDADHCKTDAPALFKIP